jgi:hypothetical protein
MKTPTFWTDFGKNTQLPNLMKIRPVGAEMFHVEAQTDGRTSIINLIVPFRTIANAPKN